MTLQVSASAVKKAASLALVHSMLRGGRTCGLACPTTLSSGAFAPRFVTLYTPPQTKGPRRLAPGPNRILRLWQDVPKQRDDVKYFFPYR